jgi:phosphatidylglycerol:prolipoprotein diacylglycerol transferase
MTYLSQAGIPVSGYTPPQGIHLGPVIIRFYSLFIAIGIIAGYYLAKGEAVRQKISPEALQVSIFYGFVGGLIGARLYHVIDQWSLYSGHLADIFAIWNGGLGILGGLAGGALGLYLFARQRGIRFLALADVWAPSLLLAQAIGRFGNWTNQEAFGQPTNGPFKVFIDAAHRPDQYAANSYFHPTFFYEAAWDLAAVLLLVLVRKRLSGKPGLTLGLYFILYGIGRFVTEFFRFDTAELFGVRAAHIFCGFLVLLGLYLIGRVSRPTPAAVRPAARSRRRR